MGEEMEEDANPEDDDCPSKWRQEKNHPAKRMKSLRRKYGLSDTFRALHPHRRTFTYFDHQSASRLDRIYVTEELRGLVAWAERL